MEKFDEITKNKIKELISQIESKSNCEFVAVISPKSGEYQFVILTVLLSVALLIGVVSSWFMALGFIAFDQLSVWFGGFLVLMLIYFYNPPFLKWLIPQKIQKKYGQILAKSSFYTFCTAKTNKNSLMLFVSIYESYVQILGSKDLLDVLDTTELESIKKQLLINIKHNNFTNGYLEAIGACGLLLEKISSRPHNIPFLNTLDDELIQL